MPFDPTKLPPPPPPGEGMGHALWRVLTDSITKTAHLNPIIDKTLEPGLSGSDPTVIHDNWTDKATGKHVTRPMAVPAEGGLKDKLKGFVQGSLEAITPGHIAAALAMAPEVAALTGGGAGLTAPSSILGLGGVPATAAPGFIGSVPVQAAALLGNAGMAGQGAVDTYKDASASTHPWTDPKVGLDALNTTLGLVGGGSAIKNIKTARAASSAIKPAVATKSALDAELELLRKDHLENGFALTPDNIHGAGKYPLISQDLKVKPAGNIAQKIWGEDGVPKPKTLVAEGEALIKDRKGLSKAEEQAFKLNQNEAASDVQINESGLKDQTDARKLAEKQLDDAFKKVEADKKLAAKGTATEAKAAEAVTKAQEKEGVQMTRNEDARNGFIKDNLVQDTRNEDAVAKFQKRMEAATNKKQQQDAIDEYLANAEIEKTTGPVRQTRKGVGPDGEAQSQTDTFRPKEADPEGVDGGSSEGGDGNNGQPPVPPTEDFHTLTNAKLNADRVQKATGVKMQITKGPDGKFYTHPADAPLDPIHGAVSVDNPEADALLGNAPAPVTAPIHPDAQLSPEIRKELENIKEEMGTFQFTKHTINHDIARQGSTPEVVGGSGGAPVYHDILSEGGYGTRGNVEAHLQNLLNGKINPAGLTKTQQAALRVAEARANGTWQDLGFSAPSLQHAEGAGARVPDVEISDYTGGDPLHTIEAPVPAGSTEPPALSGNAAAIAELEAEQAAKAQGTPPPAMNGGSSPIIDTQGTANPDPLRSPLPDQPLPTGPVEPTLPGVEGPIGGVPKPLATVQDNFNLTGGDATTPPVQNSLLNVPEAPVEAPPSEGGAAPIRFFKSPLEAAGTNYGDIKAAKAAGEVVPEEGRAIAGKAAARLKKEVADANPTSADLEKMPELQQDSVLREMVKRFMAEKSGSEKGAAPAGVPLRMTGAALGGMAGNEEDPLGNKPASTAAGVAGGFFLPEVAKGMMKALPRFEDGIAGSRDNLATGARFVNQLHNTALLSPLSVGKKAAGDIGGLSLAALENPDKAKGIISQFISGEGRKNLVNNFKEGFNGPNQEPLGGLELSGILNHKANPMSWSGRMMGGLTTATKGVLGEAGFTAPEQRYYTLTDYPHYKATENLYNGVRNNEFTKHLVPFARVGVNRLERGYEYSPFGLANLLMKGHADEAGKTALKAGLGTLAGVAAYKETPENYVKEHPIAASSIAALGGPLGIPIIAGMALKNHHSEGLTMSDATGEIARDIPGLRLIEDASGKNPKGFARNYFSGYTNFLRPAALLTDPKTTVDSSFPFVHPGPDPAMTAKDNRSLTPTDEIFSRMLSNIPGVREQLPKKGSEDLFAAPSSGGPSGVIAFDPATAFKVK